MQAVILAAGASSRFYPLSENLPKAMIQLLGKPLLAHTITELAKVDIRNIILVVNPKSSVKDYFSDGQKFGVKIAYVFQEKPLGMADALLKAKSLIKEDFFLLHGHHFDVGGFAVSMLQNKGTSDGVLLVRERENPWEFGVVKLEKERIVGLVEKPLKGTESGKICVVGIYLLTPEFLPFLGKTKSCHYQLENALNEWVKKRNLRALIAQTQPLSLKYPWDLLSLKNYLLEKAEHKISRGARIGKGVILVGKMVIEDGAVIHENAVIKGPVYIGRDALVGNNALVRDASCLELGSHVGAFSEVKNSLVLSNAHLGSGFVASSIIGEKCRLAHGFTSANRRFDRKSIKVKVKGEIIDSGLDDLGVIMGQGVYCGINVGTMPGKTIGSGAIIGPGTFVFEDVAAGVHYKTEFKNTNKKRAPVG